MGLEYLRRGWSALWRNEGLIMIAFYLICAVIGGCVFILLRHYPAPLRWLAAILTVIILSMAVTVIIARIGDRSVGDTRTINIGDMK
jgi:hypothetical protein